MPCPLTSESWLLFAEQTKELAWWFFPMAGLLGLAGIGVGIHQIRTRRVELRRLDVLRLFGIQELTGTWAVLTGGMKVFGGVIAVLIGVTGPFWIPGAVDEQNRRQQAGAPLGHNPGRMPATPPVLRAGGERGEAFEDASPQGGVLVGLRLAKGKSWGGAIQAVQPIYQVETRYVLGARHGTEGGEEHQVVAKPGYAVGTVNARAGLVLNAVQLVFYRVDGTRLDPADRYESEWIGCAGGGPYRLDAAGEPITAIFGSWSEDIVSLGITPSPSLAKALPSPTEPPPELVQPTPEKTPEESLAAAPSVDEPPATAVPPATAPTESTANVEIRKSVETPETSEPMEEPVKEPDFGGISMAEAPAMTDEERAALGKRMIDFGRPAAGDTHGGLVFGDQAPAGGLLVGMRLAKGTTRDGAIQAVRPIYKLGDKYFLGHRHGKPGGEEHQVLAKEGYAVGSVEVRTALVLNAVRLIFYRVDGKTLREDDRYESDWIGRDGGGPKTLDPHGQPITGIFGTWKAGEDLLSLGIRPHGVSTHFVGASVRGESGTEPSTLFNGNSRDGDRFVDAAPEGGLLVGLRLAQGTNWGGALNAVQPIYQVGKKQVRGRRYGIRGGRETEILAKSGYAVGALNTRVGLAANAVQAVFYRVDGTRLNPEDRYESPWVGSEGGGLKELDAKGGPIIGIFGAGKADLCAIGIVPAEELGGTVAQVSTPPAVKSSGASDDGFREWTSADGKFRIRAKFVDVENGTVRLERDDKRVIPVPLSKLSAADVAYVKEQE